MSKAKGLGMGLDALLGGSDESMSPKTKDSGSAQPMTLSDSPSLPLTSLQAGRFQPRQDFDDEAIKSLAASMEQHGLMQPIVVRRLDKLASEKSAKERKYEIIAGERRYRAAKLLGWLEIDVTYRDVGDQSVLAMGLIENIQREDLNPIEQAHGVERLIDEFGYTHEQAATALGRSRSAVSNLLRLLNLAEPVQEMLVSADLDLGHARALLALDRAEQVMLARQVAQLQLTVRETENKVTLMLASRLTSDADGSDGKRNEGSRRIDPDILRLQEQIADSLATPVKINANAKGRGKLTIEFSDHEQFEGLLQRLGIRI